MGERDSWALQRSVTGGGWRELPDLTPFKTREQVAAVVEETYGKDKPEALSNYTGQLWALRDRIAVGDLVVMPIRLRSRSPSAGSPEDTSIWLTSRIPTAGT